MIKLFFISVLFFAGAYEPAEDQLIQTAQQALSELYPDAKFTAEVRWIPSSLKAVFDEGEIEEVRFQGHSLPRGLTRVEVTTPSGAHPAQLFIQTEIKIPVLKQNVEKGNLVQQENIDLNWVDVTGFNQLPLTSLEENRLVARSRLAAGSPLFPNHLEQEPVVKRGDTVQMIYRDSSLSISLTCEPRKPGAAGEKITIDCDETGKRYEAVVLNSETVEWKKTL